MKSPKLNKQQSTYIRHTGVPTDKYKYLANSVNMLVFKYNEDICVSVLLFHNVYFNLRRHKFGAVAVNFQVYTKFIDVCLIPNITQTQILWVARSNERRTKLISSYSRYSFTSRCVYI